MPVIDLSSLDGPELRRLLDSARRQGQATQTYEILQEMEARRQRGPRPKHLSLKRPPRKAHTITLALGDPLDRKEDPLLDETTDDLPPLTLAEPPPPQPPPEPAPAARKSQGWAHWGALIFAFGLAGGVAGGWWASEYANGGAPGPATPAAAPAPHAAVQTAALSPALPPANAETPVSLVPEPASATLVPPPPPPPAQDTASAATPAAATPVQTAEIAPPPAPAPAPVAAAPAAVEQADTPPAKDISAAKPATKTAAAAETTCGSEPADRTICADPKLRRLQTELRDAYAEALKAHEDKALLRQRELAWAEARNSVTDPNQLASLYRERIGKLRAATADAMRLRHQPTPAAD